MKSIWSIVNGVRLKTLTVGSSSYEKYLVDGLRRSTQKITLLESKLVSQEAENKYINPDRDPPICANCQLLEVTKTKLQKAYDKVTVDLNKNPPKAGASESTIVGTAKMLEVHKDYVREAESNVYKQEQQLLEAKLDLERKKAHKDWWLNTLKKQAGWSEK